MAETRLKWAFGAVALGVAQSALAQNSPQLIPAAPTGTDQGVGVIVVTAQKRSESAQRIPLSVESLGGEALAHANVKDLFQAVTLVPGVVFSRAPDDGLALTFRGLGTSARPQAFEQSVAVFTDGVVLGKGRLYSTSFFDVSRVEFIKGTQSTLLGKNASIGAISMISRQPGNELALEGSAGYEFKNSGYTIDGAADVPLGAASGLRLAGHYNDLYGWVSNDRTAHKGPEQKDLGLRATLKTGIGGLRLTGSYQYADNQQIGASYQLVGAIPAVYGDGKFDDHTSQFTSLTSNGETYHDTRSNIGNLRGEFDLGHVTLVSQTAYVTYKLHFIDDFDFSPDDSINFLRDEKYRQFTQELRLQSPTGGKIEYMGGLFYLTSHWHSVEGQIWRVPGFPPSGGPPPGQLFNGPFVNDFVQGSKAYSAFASGTYHIGEDLRLAAGLRYTREDKNVVFGRTPLPPFTVWNTIANPPFDPTPLSHHSKFLDGNISVQYDFSREVMGYVSFGHGSKSGGFVETNTVAIPPALLFNGKVPAALVAEGTAIKDEYTKGFEAGLKTTLLDHRLRLNLALYYVDVKDFQDSVFTGGPLGFITFNGPAKSKGFEIETAFQATPHFRVDGGLTYADATSIIQPVDATGTPIVDASGQPVLAKFRRTQAPKMVFNAGATFTHELTDMIGLRLNASVRHRSSMFNQLQERLLSAPLTTLDLSGGIEGKGGRWGIDLAARNVTNEFSQDFASPSVDPRFGAFYGAYLAGPNPGRTVTLTARFKY